MEVADKSKTKGMIIMSIVVPNPPGEGGVKLALETGKESLRRTASMEEEMHALAENKTWDLVDTPKCVKPIGCIKVKYNTDCSINQYKTRLLVKGYAQQHGINYDKTFAPVTKMTIVHFLLAVNSKGLEFAPGGCQESFPTKRT